MMLFIQVTKPLSATGCVCVGGGGGAGAVVTAACLKSRGFEPQPDLQASKEQNVSSPLTRNYSKLWGTRDREVACSTSDRQGSNFESCV